MTSGTGGAPVRVLLVDDQALIRRGLHTLLDLEPRIRVVGEAADGEAALRLLETVPVDVALVDVRMPGMSGLQLIARISRTHPGVACLVLTTFDEDEFLFGGLIAGARGFLLKDAALEELVAAIATAASGGTVVHGQVAGRLVARLAAPTPPPVAVDARADPLTGREREVAELVATGAANREIAERLYLTEGTVKNHISAALRKLGFRDRTQLALHIAGHGRSRLADGPTGS